MTIDDVRGYIKEKNLITKARNRDIIAKKHYLTGYMFWELKMSLSAIGREWGNDHVTVRSALIGLYDWQRHADFREYTTDLQYQIPMVFPEYTDIKVKEEDIEYELTIHMSKKEFHHFIDNNYSKEFLIDLVFKKFVKSASVNSKTTKGKRKYVRQINFPSKGGDNRE